MGQQVERDGEHMWLRQSVTFSVDGQSRTLEIGIPLRAGATPEEIEALLAEADAGMEHIGRHLEARIARLSGETPSSAPTAAVGNIPTRSEPPAASEPAELPVPHAPAVEIALPPASAPVAPAMASPPAAPAPTPAPARAIAGRQASTPPTPAPASAPATASAATKPDATGSERAQASAPAPARATPPPANTGAPMTIPEFIAAAQAEQGLNPKQAMERLGVKSLAGLNLREALEMLRRQALRDGTGPTAVEAQPASAPAPPPTSAPTAPPVSSSPPRYFEEEDDAADIIFTEEDDALDAEAEAAGYGAVPLGEEDDEYEALDEVPDFGSPPAATVPEQHATPAPAAPPSRAPAATSASKEAAPETSRAARILTHMRGVRGGGVASAHQRTAFKNIVVAELGEPKAKALIAGIWRITPEKLGPEQLDALNNWGKRETFAEDTELVLAAVKAEREQGSEREQAGAVESTGEPGAAPARGSERAAPTRTAPRRASRAAPTGGA